MPLLGALRLRRLCGRSWGRCRLHRTWRPVVPHVCRPGERPDPLQERLRTAAGTAMQSAPRCYRLVRPARRNQRGPSRRWSAKGDIVTKLMVRSRVCHGCCTTSWRKCRRPGRRRSRRARCGLAVDAGCLGGTWFGGRTRLCEGGRL